MGALRRPDDDELLDILFGKFLCAWVRQACCGCLRSTARVEPAGMRGDDAGPLGPPVPTHNVVRAPTWL